MFCEETCSVRKSVLRNFAEFAGKRPCQILFFNKVAGLRPVTLFKRGLWRGCFTVGFAEFLRTPFVAERLRTTASVY